VWHYEVTVSSVSCTWRRAFNRGILMKYFIWLWSTLKVWKCVTGNETCVRAVGGKKTIRTDIKNGKSFGT